MTAIAGFWRLDAPHQPVSQCRKMLEAQSQYGPAEPNLTDLGDFSLGRGLYPLLPEDDHDRQPLIGGNGRFALVADIRLDNRAELAGALGRKVGALACVPDSRLLLTALEHWGEECLTRLVGDYAFAWVDLQEHRLLLARDPLGQRPLFWCGRKDFVAFASMPKGLHAIAGIERAPNAETIARFVALLPPNGSSTFFKDIQRVEPGHVVTISPAGAKTRRYWAPTRTELRLRTFQDYVDAYRAHLDEAVACRMRSRNQVVATHLSGGWDSSAVTSTAARLAKSERLVAFTSVPLRGVASAAPGQRFADEGPLAHEVAKAHPNISHLLIEGTGASPLPNLGRDIDLFERPSFNLTNHVWLADIRAAAREAGAEVLLTGEIGNWTISAAPPSILADLLREGRWLSWSREAAAMLRDKRARMRGVAANSFGPWLPNFLWRRLVNLSSAPRLHRQTALNPALADLLIEMEQTELGRLGRPKDNYERTLAALNSMDFGEYRKGILAGWGIDKRDATADRRLVEFCLSLPIEMLLKNGVRRPLARAALSDRIPAALLNETRKGYQAADWHIGLTRDLPAIYALVEEISQHEVAASILDVASLRKWLQEWPASNWSDPFIIARYRTALPQALTSGYFAITASR